MTDYPVPYHPTWDVIDPSKMDTFAVCRRKFFFEYILGWRFFNPVKNDKEFGAAWHAGQEYLLLNGYDSEGVQGAYQEFLEEYRKYFEPDTDERFTNKNPQTALEAFVEYSIEYKLDLREFEVLHTEVSASVPISAVDRIYLKMDNILRHEKGYYFSLEHKTGKNLSGLWLNQWDLSFQVGAYTHALYCMFPIEEVRGIKVNGTFFLKTKRNFARVPAWRSFQQMQVWLVNFNYYFQELKHEMEELSHASVDDSVMTAFPMCTQNCMKYGVCEYNAFCNTWPNPIQQSFEPPLGYYQEWWDPRREDKEVINLEWEKTDEQIEAGISAGERTWADGRDAEQGGEDDEGFVPPSLRPGGAV